MNCVKGKTVNNSPTAASPLKNRRNITSSVEPQITDAETPQKRNLLAFNEKIYFMCPAHRFLSSMKTENTLFLVQHYQTILD